MLLLLRWNYGQEPSGKWWVCRGEDRPIIYGFQTEYDCQTYIAKCIEEMKRLGL
jgi:hypothetical protein